MYIYVCIYKEKKYIRRNIDTERGVEAITEKNMLMYSTYKRRGSGGKRQKDVIEIRTRECNTCVICV